MHITSNAHRLDTEIPQANTIWNFGLNKLPLLTRTRRRIGTPIHHTAVSSSTKPLHATHALIREIGARGQI